MTPARAYIAHLVDQGSSANTIAAYANDLRQLEQWLVQRKRSPEVDWRRVGRADLLAYDDHLARSCASATRHRKRASTLGFVHWLAAEQRIPTDPLELGFPRLGFVKPAPTLLSAEEIAALLAAPTRGRTHRGQDRGDAPLDLRGAAMLRLLATTGMRVSELIALDADEDLDLASNYVRVFARDARERHVPFDVATRHALADYLGRARPMLRASGSGSEALFLNHLGERLTRQGFWLILRQYAKAAGITKAISPHTLRHSFAVQLLADNASLRDVQWLLGHVNVSTTEVYLVLAKQRRSA